jgi:hypothetical protein
MRRSATGLSWVRWWAIRSKSSGKYQSFHSIYTCSEPCAALVSQLSFISSKTTVRLIKQSSQGLTTEALLWWYQGAQCLQSTIASTANLCNVSSSFITSIKSGETFTWLLLQRFASWYSSHRYGQSSTSQNGGYSGAVSFLPLGSQL